MICIEADRRDSCKMAWAHKSCSEPEKVSLTSFSLSHCCPGKEQSQLVFLSPAAGMVLFLALLFGFNSAPLPGLVLIGVGDCS